ncbi:hypothetical protein IMY05_C4628000900 [Salix suchowensis]|nr:hypothetical protein IMY05_C4628000900 [Salix suchowensis]
MPVTMQEVKRVGRPPEVDENANEAENREGRQRGRTRDKEIEGEIVDTRKSGIIIEAVAMLNVLWNNGPVITSARRRTSNGNTTSRIASTRGQRVDEGKQHITHLNLSLCRKSNNTIPLPKTHFQHTIDTATPTLLLCHPYIPTPSYASQLYVHINEYWLANPFYLGYHTFKIKGLGEYDLEYLLDFMEAEVEQKMRDACMARAKRLACFVISSCSSRGKVAKYRISCLSEMELRSVRKDQYGFKRRPFRDHTLLKPRACRYHSLTEFSVDFRERSNMKRMATASLHTNGNMLTNSRCPPRSHIENVMVVLRTE